MDKEKFIEWVKEFPEDIKIFITEKDNYDCVNVKIFTEHKSESFIREYFAP